MVSRGLWMEGNNGEGKLRKGKSSAYVAFGKAWVQLGGLFRAVGLLGWLGGEYVGRS